MRYSGSPVFGPSTTSSMPNAAALRNSPPTLSGLLTPSSTSTRDSGPAAMRSSVGVGRALDQRQAAAMDVEAGDVVHRLLLDEIDRRRGQRQHVGKVVGGRLRQQDRFDRPVPQLDQPPHDQAALGDEHAELGQPIRIGDGAITGEARVIEVTERRVSSRNHSRTMRSSARPAGGAPAWRTNSRSPAVAPPASTIASAPGTLSGADADERPAPCAPPMPSSCRSRRNTRCGRRATSTARRRRSWTRARAIRFRPPRARRLPIARLVRHVGDRSAIRREARPRLVEQRAHQDAPLMGGDVEHPDVGAGQRLELGEGQLRRIGRPRRRELIPRAGDQRRRRRRCHRPAS